MDVREDTHELKEEASSSVQSLHTEGTRPRIPFSATVVCI